MTKLELLEKLLEIKKSDDPEQGHAEADDSLLEYINDADVTAAFTALTRWYA